MYLSKYNYRVKYDSSEFALVFPESLITAALQSNEEEIPLDNPLVTPATLDVLSQILETKKYTYISDPLMKKRLDYLGIDVPEMVYDPKYVEFTRAFPDVEWDHIDSNYPDGDIKYVIFGMYSDILDYVIKHEYWTLAQHLFNHTNPQLHLRADGFFVNGIVDLGSPTPARTSMILTVLKTRGIVKDYFSMVGVAVSGYLEVMKYIHETWPSVGINYIDLTVKNIARHMDNFSYIVPTLEYIRSLIPNPAIIEGDIESLKTYRIFMDVYTGNEEDLPIALEDVARTFYGNIDSIATSLLFTAILTDHANLIPLVLDSVESYRLDVHMKYFMRVYMARQDLITVKDFRIIVRYLSMELVKKYIDVVQLKNRPDLYEVLKALI